MGTRGLEIVRFRRRYYIRYHQYDSYFDGLGVKIVNSIPSNPEAYQEWIVSLRQTYAAKERALEQGVYEFDAGSRPNLSLFEEFEELPSELPRLSQHDYEYSYIIDLDREVLTMNDSIHWKLSNIPRKDNLWLRAIADSKYRNIPTVCLDICPEDHLVSLALDLLKSNGTASYPHHQVTPRLLDITEAPQAFLLYVMARILIEYKDVIVRFGREWSPASLPFRELIFALVSVASGNVEFHSFPEQKCNPRTCAWYNCKNDHLPESIGWFDSQWAKHRAPILEFGSHSHHPGEPPGVSPTETTYWQDNVLISLVLVIDEAAVSAAATYGIEQGRDNFQIALLTLFKVFLAEIRFDGVQHIIHFSQPLSLSPVTKDDCLSTHPRERPELGATIRGHIRDVSMHPCCTDTLDKLQHRFPGLAALVRFFDAAAGRRAGAFKSAGVFPPEIYERILDFADRETWMACSTASTGLRALALSRYRLDERMAIISGPLVRMGGFGDRRRPVMAFGFEDLETGDKQVLMTRLSDWVTERYNWMPVLGSKRKALMVDVNIQFTPAGDDTEPGAEDEA